jgi:hypothetical protein
VSYRLVIGWYRLGLELVELAIEELDHCLASQQTFDFNDDLPF